MKLSESNTQKENPVKRHHDVNRLTDAEPYWNATSEFVNGRVKPPVKSCMLRAWKVFYRGVTSLHGWITGADAVREQDTAPTDVVLPPCCRCGPETQTCSLDSATCGSTTSSQGE